MNMGEENNIFKQGQLLLKPDDEDLTFEQGILYLETSLKLKEGIIDYLQDDIRKKSTDLEQKEELIEDLHNHVVMFYQILSELKFANSKKEIKKILSSYNIDLEVVPSFH